MKEGRKESKVLLDHVEDALVLVEPNVMIGNGNVLKGDLFCVLEKGIWPPHLLQPRGGQETVVGRQIIRETQSIVLPLLREENVRRVRLQGIGESQGK